VATDESLSADAVLGICTFHRNEKLTAMLERASELCDVDGAPRLAVFIADDSSDGAAEVVAQVFNDHFRGGMSYRHVGSGNISTARNVVLDECRHLAPFVAVMDDDCMPEPGWLVELLEMERSTNADIVTGHRVFGAPADAPKWLVEQPFFSDQPSFEDGSEPGMGPTGNALFSSAWLSSRGVRFDPAFGKAGGEDMVFYAEARKHGAVIRHAAHSVVTEDFTGSRLTFRYHLFRQFWLGNNIAQINRTTHEAKPTRLLLRCGKAMLRAVAMPFANLIRRKPPQFRWALATVGRSVGLALGVFGVTIDHKT
jgi:succinoglycan biosynthesis protein ExoM